MLTRCKNALKSVTSLQTPLLLGNCFEQEARGTPELRGEKDSNRKGERGKENKECAMVVGEWHHSRREIDAPALQPVYVTSQQRKAYSKAKTNSLLCSEINYE